MDYFSAALGVQCNFCHVTSQFDSDDRPGKATARKMIQMVKNFNGNKENGITIQCATCHHGRNQPERTPPLAIDMTPAEAAAAAARAAAPRQGGPGGGAPAAQAPAAPGGQAAPGRGAPEAAGAAPQGRGQQRPTETADQVIDKFVQAMGGQAALAQAKTIVLHGTATTRDLQSNPVTVQEKATGEYRMDVDMKPQPMIRGFNGKDTWVLAFGNVHDLEGIQAAQATRLADFGLPLEIKKRYPTVTVGRYGNLDGVNTISLTARVDENVSEQMQFDRQTGLLLRRTIQTRTPYGSLAEQVDYSDFRDVSGVKVPFGVRYATWNQVTTEKFSDAKINAPVDDAVFAKPAGK
jgi:hypothetical protein